MRDQGKTMWEEEQGSKGRKVGVRGHRNMRRRRQRRMSGEGEGMGKEEGGRWQTEEVVTWWQEGVRGDC